MSAPAPNPAFGALHPAVEAQLQPAPHRFVAARLERLHELEREAALYVAGLRETVRPGARDAESERLDALTGGGL